MEDESPNTAAIEIARKAALSTIAAVLTAFVLGNPIAGAAVGSTVIGLGEKLASFEIRRRQRAVERWWRTMLEDETRSPENLASLETASPASWRKTYSFGLTTFLLMGTNLSTGAH